MNSLGSNDFFFRPKLNPNLHLAVDGLLTTVSKIYSTANNRVQNGCRGLRIVDGHVALCEDETVESKPYCRLHTDIERRSNMLYHEVDVNFDKIVNIFSRKMNGSMAWNNELRDYSGLLSRDQNYIIEKRDIELIQADWVNVFNVIDNVEIFNYMETLDDAVYAFLVADLIYSLRVLHSMLLFDDIGIDPGHLTYMIYLLRVRNKLASIINLPHIDINLTPTLQEIKRLTEHIDHISETIIYIYGTLEFFTTFNKVSLANKFNPFFQVERNRIENRDKILLDVLIAIDNNNQYLDIFKTQEPRNNCDNIITITKVNESMLKIPNEALAVEPGKIKFACNQKQRYEDLYDLFNCIVLRVNTKFSMKLVPTKRVEVRSRPDNPPNERATRDIIRRPSSRLASYNPRRTVTRTENVREIREPRRTTRYTEEHNPFAGSGTDTFSSRSQRASQLTRRT